MNTKDAQNLLCSKYGDNENDNGTLIAIHNKYDQITII